VLNNPLDLTIGAASCLPKSNDFAHRATRLVGRRGWVALSPSPTLSCSAQAEHPVSRSRRDRTETSRRTGSSAFAFADHDSGVV